MNEFLENSTIAQNEKETIKMLCELFYTAGVSDNITKTNDILK